MDDRQEIHKLQEQVIFTDRTVEQLNEEMVQMTQHMGELTTRLTRLEHRLQQLLDNIERLEDTSHDAADERPPHWGPPPIDS